MFSPGEHSNQLAIKGMSVMGGRPQPVIAGNQWYPVWTTSWFMLPVEIEEEGPWYISNQILAASIHALGETIISGCFKSAKLCNFS